MADKILVITVGGSCEPIVNAVKADSYDKIFFVCSTGGKQGSERTVDGKGNPCRKGRDDKQGNPSIVEQASVSPERYEKILLEQHELDDLSLAYRKMKELAKRISTGYPDAEVIANFTGGTKTMSACLVMAAIAFDWQLYFNQGVRTDIEKVMTGDEPVPVSVEDLLEERYAALVNRALEVHDYSMAAAIASEFVRKIWNPVLRRKWLAIENMAEGFSLWDAFSYKDALPLLEVDPKAVGNWLAALRNLTYRERPHHGYYVVFDLINNAERRAVQKRYDDAVSRLYRATELVAQTRLKEAYQLESGAIKTEDLRQRFRDYISGPVIEQYSQRADEKGVVKLGLHESYTLLAKLKDPVGMLFLEQENRILDILKTRNFSFLAHGSEPIGQEDYGRVQKVLAVFIEEAIKKVAPSIKMPPQFPKTRFLQ